MKKKKDSDIILNDDEMKIIQNDYDKILESPEYSLEPDPENKYGMSDSQKQFVTYFVQFKNVATAAELCGIDMDVAKQFYVSYASQNEIRRINRALYHRQFSSQMLRLDDIGGYLSSLITDENVPIGDQLKTPEKVKVAGMLIELIKLKSQGMLEPSNMLNKDINDQIKNLSVTTIQRLLNNMENPKNKLSKEEVETLKDLPTDDLLNFIEEFNEGEKNDKTKTKSKRNL